MKSMLIAAASLLTYFCAAGCGSATSSAPGSQGTTITRGQPSTSDAVPPETAAAAQRAEPKYTVTRVDLGPGGETVVSLQHLTTGEMIQHRNALRAIKQSRVAPGRSGGIHVAETIKDPYGCEYDDVVLADNSNGYGSQICFSGKTTGSPLGLTNYSTGDSEGYWDEAVRSYWGSDGDIYHDPTRGDQGEDGYLKGWSLSSGFCYEYFTSTATGFTNAGPCGRIASWIDLTD